MTFHKASGPILKQPRADHHTGLGFDPSKLAIHKAKAEWALHYGNDYDLTDRTQDALRHLLKG